MSLLVCPVCGKELEKNDKVYKCENSHSFDIAKKGYVNLLMSSSKGKIHGDDKAMISARAAFLNRGFYDELSSCIAELCEKHCESASVVLDAGCGEGKYTSDIAEKLIACGKGECSVLGVDISKDAVNLAAGRDKRCTFAVASAASLPVSDKSADVLVSIFAPFFADEFSRVLRDDGIIIRAFPLPRHLWELKELVYDTPYENPDADMEEKGFVISKRREVCFNMKLSGEDMKNLFVMTPYFYRTSEKDLEKLSGTDELYCRAEFGIVVYTKEPRSYI